LALPTFMPHAFFNYASLPIGHTSKTLRGHLRGQVYIQYIKTYTIILNMPGPLRIEYEDAYYHAMNRGGVGVKFSMMIVIF